MTHDRPEIVGDATTFQPPSPETWVEWRLPIKVVGGIPNIIVEDEYGVQYRHTLDGRLWKLVACTT